MSSKVGKVSAMLSPESADRPRYHSFRSGSGVDLTGKDILVFCDGSGKDGRTGSENKTNVWKLYKLALARENTDEVGWGPIRRSTLRQHEIVYLPGVGSGSNRNPYNLLVRLFGSTIVDNILDAYLHVAKHYEARSNIYLFGYSRGAFVVRKVASLIYRIGIIRDKEEVLRLWDSHERPVAWNLINSPPRGTVIEIQAVVVWDTVGAIRSVHPKSKMEADILGMPDEELPPNVNHALHVVAFHENRKLFRVTLFQPDSKQLVKLKEVWFPGAHADVGGGDVNAGLPNISLIWIIGELQASCSLFICHHDLDYPTEIQGLSPSDAYHESPKWKRLLDKCENRLALLRKSSLVHETVLYLKNSMPDYLDPRANSRSPILTISDLGLIGWDIKTSLVPRNDFELQKHTYAKDKKRNQDRTALDRGRVNSLQLPRALGPSMAGTAQTQGSDRHAQQSRKPNIVGDVPRNASGPSPLIPYKTSTRHRAGSHAIARTQIPVLSQTNAHKLTSDTRRTARHEAPSGGVLAFQESTPGARGPPQPGPLLDHSKLKPREKDRANKAPPKVVQRHDTRWGQ
ncbi:putative protein YEL023C OS=Saccharomyces cerevisiae (strain ATCC 204508 / S288c) GN=YEL023C PE=4 SV=1 [Rhizoctonia solani AG-1 IB]|uniref:T6SS Phospholipase effector Tle1-like catalytic domain-containing protein n=1 Tax=Thanatephorus cucumeris (strain AG1-IB / isolate 7/3/14) TaxID=1108050 RepID=A0A0B7FY77_THACB|nr:putative protein YEL023C OS=Saccharomyces cerevisiae (strain ATCC 204508 / S288c) GN=YEL023C PE=4 SV=1 [Rhizoctonia solani AG-1 IB]